MTHDTKNPVRTVFTIVAVVALVGLLLVLAFSAVAAPPDDRTCDAAGYPEANKVEDPHDGEAPFTMTGPWGTVEANNAYDQGGFESEVIFDVDALWTVEVCIKAGNLDLVEVTATSLTESLFLEHDVSHMSWRDPVPPPNPTPSPTETETPSQSPTPTSTPTQTASPTPTSTATPGPPTPTPTSTTTPTPTETPPTVVTPAVPEVVPADCDNPSTLNLPNNTSVFAYQGPFVEDGRVSITATLYHPDIHTIDVAGTGWVLSDDGTYATYTVDQVGPRDCTPSETPSPSPTSTVTPTVSPTSTPTPTPTETGTPSPTDTPSQTPSPAPSTPSPTNPTTDPPTSTPSEPTQPPAPSSTPSTPESPSVRPSVTPPTTPPSSPLPDASSTPRTELPRTGLSVWWLAGAGWVLAAVGAVAVATGRAEGRR